MRVGEDAVEVEEDGPAHDPLHNFTLCDSPSANILLIVNNIKGGALAEILSVSLTSEVRRALDAEAKRQRRSRSFVVAEAVREYVARQRAEAFRAGRDQTLRDALSLTPAERLREAEDLWQELSRDFGPGPGKPWTASFDTFAEYDAWRRR